ncbi:hypothetical protein Lepto7375DRAFT_2772 [Leptolyngbya sp. PCC 7375]|nr:hypothetical protein Lepto7375DRAFT_2772 [Leptolyngbya sp. PCC 7375]
MDVPICASIVYAADPISVMLDPEDERLLIEP